MHSNVGTDLCSDNLLKSYLQLNKDRTKIAGELTTFNLSCFTLITLRKFVNNRGKWAKVGKDTVVLHHYVRGVVIPSPSPFAAILQRERPAAAVERQEQRQKEMMEGQRAKEYAVVPA